MRTGEELALNAMKKELARLIRAADRAKKEADECCHIGTELIAIHEDFVAVVKSELTPEAQLKKLDALKKRSDRAEKIRKKDLTKLFDKENKTAWERDELKREVSSLEFMLSMRKAG